MVNLYGLPVQEIILLAFGESKKDLLLSRKEDICSFIDDSSQHIKDMVEIGVPSALVRRPWNKEFAHVGGELAGAHEFPSWLESGGLLGYRAPRPPRP